MQRTDKINDETAVGASSGGAAEESPTVGGASGGRGRPGNHDIVAGVGEGIPEANDGFEAAGERFGARRRR